MLIEQPSNIIRRLLPEGMFRNEHPEGERRVYLTFDDGPIPEVTPWILDILDRYGVKATFFMVGDNARRHRNLYEEVVARGHRVGNHTMHHLQGLKENSLRYLRDVEEAAEYIESNLFRPPHGWLRRRQAKALQKKYTIVMYDLVTRDYSKWLDSARVLENVRRYSRPGSIIVFHDSLKSLPRIREALPAAIEWLKGEGYEFGTL